ncbi:MAG: CBS domain-containing protein [Chloroflexi bacterium]|nr:CBS domain-containing protein [Chloroflexota bacterium]MCL5108025.1 CBS domain-containing protein [Chloroflexota bacterium]
MKAKFLMTQEVITVGPDADIDEATKLLLQHHISGVPVVNETGEVVGVFSTTDVLARRGQLVRDVMTSPAVCVGPDTSMEEVATLLVAKDINRVPVVQEGRLVGIVCRADIVRYVASKRAWVEARKT